MSLLFLDLETVPANELITNDDLRGMVPGNYKKPESIEKFLNDNRAELEAKVVKQRSLDPYQCKIVCLSYAFNHEEIQAITGTEENIMKIFENRISEHLKEFGGSANGIHLSGHNIKEFDAPILFFRAVKYKLINLHSMLFYGRREMKDTMDFGTYYVYGKRVSLDTLCQYYGIPSPKGEMDGSKIYPAYKAGRIEDIAKYCNEDVEAERTLYYNFAG